MKRFSAIVLILILGVGLTGCNTARRKVVPPCDQVLVYKLAFDLTYLRALEALGSQGSWQYEETDKEKGLISVRDMNYSSLDDSDVRVISFVVKRVDRETTSVALTPKSRQVYGGAGLMKAVDEALRREIKR